MDKPRPDPGKSTVEMIAMESARQIQEELIRDFASKSEYSDWWSDREQTGNGAAVAGTAPKKANPRNVRNSERVRELEAEIQRFVPFFFVVDLGKGGFG
jgi:kinetochore protein Mis13/DSN1